MRSARRAGLLALPLLLLPTGPAGAAGDAAGSIHALESELANHFAGITVFAVGSRSVAIVGKQYGASPEELAKRCAKASEIIADIVPRRAATVVWKETRKDDYRCEPVAPSKARRGSLEDLIEAARER